MGFIILISNYIFPNYISYHNTLQGATEHNITLKLSYPLVNGSKYTFTNFLTESVDHLGTTDHVLKVYAKNTLGDVHVKDVTFALGNKQYSFICND